MTYINRKNKMINQIIRYTNEKKIKPNIAEKLLKTYDVKLKRYKKK